MSNNTEIDIEGQMRNVTRQISGMKREELINSLKPIIIKYLMRTEYTPYHLENDLADFILARETAMLEEIEKPLKGLYKCVGADICTEAVDAVNEALSIIQRRKGVE